MFLQATLARSTLVVAIDPGKVMNRVWVSDGDGPVTDPVSIPVSRAGIQELERAVSGHTAEHGEVIIAIEATGSLHQPWAAELERLHPGSLRLFAPSETKAARTQLGSGRFKTDDRDCAALTYLARQGAGRTQAEETAVDELRGAVRHRRGLIADRTKAKQRLHDQLNALAPGLSAPAPHGRALPIESPTGQAVLDCVVAFAGRPPSVRSLIARAPGRLTLATAQYWQERWRGCLPPPPDAHARAERLGRALQRYQSLQEDVVALEADITLLLAPSAGQILTTLPGSGRSARPRSPHTASPSHGSPTQTTSTPPPASRPPSKNPRPSGDADGSPGKAWPSTATRS